MKLVSLWVDGYKNLLDLNVEFPGNCLKTAIIGNNGTGKSNLLEAILTIFIKLYFGEVPKFRFRIIYTVHAKHVDICKKSDDSNCVITVDDLVMGENRFRELAQNPMLRPPFPELIFGYYSGTCKRLTRLFERYNRHYSRKLRSGKSNLESSFIFSDVDQAKFILIALLAHRKLEFLSETSVHSLENLTVTLQTPKNFDSEKDDPEFWGTVGAIRLFLADLDSVASNKKRIWMADNDGVITGSKERRTYIFDQQALEKIGSWSNARGVSVFSMLQVLKTKNMLHSAEFEIVHVDTKTRFQFEDLSEGEKQLISVIGGLHLLKQQECLVLLDEPDTHLNPAWTWKYNSLLKDAMSSSGADLSKIFLTTHNPILISGLTKDEVLIAHRNGNRLSYARPHRDPRGQGIANVLTSEFFGLPSSLDEYTQRLMDERLAIAMKKGKLSAEDSVRLAEINVYLDHLGLTISFRDPEERKREEERYKPGDRS
jgi:ABC-type cobalamin/Fe3+-siderophores transport system ATPase subunit